MPHGDLRNQDQVRKVKKGPHALENKGKLRRFRHLVFFSKCTIYFEKLWPDLWPFFVSSSLLLAVVLFDIFPFFSATLHFVLLLVIMGLCIGTLTRAFSKVKWTGQTEAIHRIEIDNDFKERPLSVLLDKPVHDPKNKVAQSIWKVHINNTLKLVPKIRLKGPVSYLGQRDKYSLRAGLMIILLLGFIEARGDMGERFERAFTPIDNIGLTKNWKVDVWITPPEHTGLRPQFISITSDQSHKFDPLIIAQHSQLMFRIEGIKQRQPLKVSLGDNSYAMTKMETDSYALETKMMNGDSIAFLRNRKPLLSLPVIVKADLPPQIQLRAEPQKGLRGHLNASYVAQDDYGLSKVRLEIDAIDRAGEETLVIEQQLSGPQKSSVFRGNFAEHIWAGREVIMTPIVEDNAGQRAYGPGIKSTLPTREFNHPIAKRLVNLRKNLFEPNLGNVIETRLWMGKLLERPQDFENNIAVYLPLRVAHDRLFQEEDMNVMAQVRKIMWETAVQLDEGNAGNARNQLEMLSQQMFDMMQMNAKSSEMEAMFEQMKQNLQRYMQQMAQNMPMMEGFENVVAPQDGEAVGQQEMENLLDRAREMMRNGNMEAAQALMNQFQSILSRLAMQKPPNPEDAEMASEIMKKLQTIQQEQQKLLDQTFQRVRHSEGNAIEELQKAAQEAQEQKTLSNMLRDEMGKLQKMNPKVPANLVQAHKAMGGAARFLESGLDESAIQSQTEALEKLIEGMQQSAQQMAQQLGMQSISRQLPGFDPMGRGKGQSMDPGEGISLPDEAELNKSRKVLQELYRRAGQKGRTHQELEYIERLLEPF